MRRFVSIFAVLIGIGMYLGIDVGPLLSAIALMMIMLAGVFYMFSRKVSSVFIESILILLFGPVFVVCLIQLVLGFLGQLFVSIGGAIDPSSILVILLLLMFLAFAIVMWERRRGHQIDRYQIQGAEREPIIPEAYHQIHHEGGQQEDEPERI
jgi:Ca2+/Na+ antiporter